MTPCTRACFHGYREKWLVAFSFCCFLGFFFTRIKASHISAVLCVIQIGFQIKTRVQDLGHGCIFLVQKAGALQITPSDSFTKRELIDCARAVTEKVMPADGVLLRSEALVV